MSTTFKPLMTTASSALLCAVAVAITLGAAPAAALIRPQPYARVAAIAVPQDLAATSPAGNVSWGAPMALRRVGAPVSAVAIGTDENDCTQKDASRANVAARPTRGFVAFRFAAPADAFYALQMQAYAPDSLANSFWLQWDEGPAVDIDVPETLEVTSTSLALPSTGGFVDACFRLAPGAHELRLYAREAGTAIAELAVDRVPPLALNRTLGCAPCFRAAPRHELTLELANFCGPSMLHPGLVRVNGQPCESLQQVGQDQLACELPRGVFDGVPADATTAPLTIELQSAHMAAPAIHTVTVGVDTISQASAAMPAWAVALIVLAVVAVFAGLVARHIFASRGTRDVSAAPQQGEGDVGLVFTDIQDSTALWAAYTLSMAATLDAHHDAVRRVVKRHGGYEVKTIGDAFVIATRGGERAVAIARDIQAELHGLAWPRCVTRHYEGERLDDDAEDTAGPEAGAAFHGPRVRIGVHVGRPDVTFDDVAKGFDYYGPDVNLAARVEAAAAGGQVLASPAALEVARGMEGVAVGETAKCTLKGVGAMPLTELVVTALPTKRVLGVSSKITDDGTVLLVPPTDELPSNAISIDSSAGTGGIVPNRFEDALARLRVTLRQPPPLSPDPTADPLRQSLELRLHLVETMLKPLKPKRREALLTELMGAWRTSVPGGVARDPTRAALAVIERVMPAEGGGALHDTSLRAGDAGSVLSPLDKSSSAHRRFSSLSSVSNHCRTPIEVKPAPHATSGDLS